MTSEFTLLLPLMTVSILAYAVPEFAYNRPVYDALLDADRLKKVEKIARQQLSTEIRSLS
jgi:H+/Cl- antiporter ClcA